MRDGAQFCTRCGAHTVAGREVPAGSVPTFERGADAGAASAQGGDDPLVGRVLDGKYEILSSLGTGGMGSVYRSRRVLIGDEVAVKLLHPRLTGDEKLVERFRREARAAAQLQHPNVVTIHDYGEARGPEAFAYIVMELVRGESLRALLRREGRFAPARAVALMRDVCAGVGAAHRRGIVHRDIKPDNIIVTPADEDSPTERVKVVDFGIAKLRDVTAEATLTEVGTVVGTLFYMSPEQCKGEPLDARADVYSLGAMLHEMLAGAPPFAATSITSLILKHVNEPPPPLPEELPIPHALRAAVLRALAKDPEARQRDASELAREIQAALTHTAASTASTQTPEPFFPATARPVPVTPTHPLPTRPNAPTQSDAAEEELTVVHEPTPARTYQTPPPPPQPEAATRPRRSNALGLVVVLLVGLCGLAAVTVVLYMRRGERRPTTANARPAATATPTPSTPTPTPSLPEAMQRAEQKILAGTLLGAADLAGLTPAQFPLLRHTVYARHGRVFGDGSLQQHFLSRPWYRPRADYSEKQLTTHDRANADLLEASEENGGRPPAADVAEVSKDVGDALKGWVESTRERDLQAHMSYYADRLETFYKKQNVPAAQVRADRQQAFVRYDDIDVKISNVDVVPDPTGTRATVAFDKTWEFDSPDKNTKGSVRQQLTFVRAGGRWLINGERDLQVYYSNSEEY